MTVSENSKFDPVAFLANSGVGRMLVGVKAKEAFFSQGDPTDCVVYLQTGRAKLTVISERGKEATITLLGAGNFIGEESIASVPGLRLATATAATACTALRIGREEMIRVMHEQHSFSDFFLKFLLARGMRTQADLVDQLFNSSEKRLARIRLRSHRERVGFFPRERGRRSWRRRGLTDSCSAQTPSPSSRYAR
jgi:CRP-like cAMP-binding protein